MKTVHTFLRIFSLVPILAGLISVNLAHASGSPAFNNLSGDDEFLKARNITQEGATYTDPKTAYHDPVQAAKPGDVVEVLAYYHNTTEGSVATNTTLKIDLPTNNDTTHVVKGTLSADNASAVHGTVVNGLEIGAPDLTITSTVPTTLQFDPKSVHWYPNRPTSLTTASEASLFDGQTGATLITSGLNLKDISGCFQFSGYVTFQVKLIGATPPPASQAVLSVKKQDRKADTNDAFTDKTTLSPGDSVEYQITVKNTDATATAKDVILKDILPSTISYTGSTKMQINSLPSVNLPDGIVTPDGLKIISELKPGDTALVSFLAKTASSTTDGSCLTNQVTASSSTASNTPQSQADICFAVGKANLTLVKEARLAGTSNSFISKPTVNPGDKVEFRLTIRNIDGVTSAKAVKLSDILPAGMTYTSPTTVLYNTVSNSLPDGVTTPDGVATLTELKPGESMAVSFTVTTDKTIGDGKCLTNTATAFSPTAKNSPQASADVCFQIVQVAAPVQPVTPVVTISPPVVVTQIPKAGPELDMLAFGGVSVVGSSLAYYQRLKRKLRRSWRSIDIV